MRTLTIAALTCAFSLTTAQDSDPQNSESPESKVYDHPIDTGSELYWWSYNPDNGTVKKPSGYKPKYNQCGLGCEECEAVEAKRCFSYQYRSCYSPYFGETCCEDMYGTTCEEGYYCAYDGRGQAYCCHEVCRDVRWKWDGMRR